VDAVDIGEAIDMAFHSLLGERLAFLCGAGLSMAPPSSLPSAGHLAHSIKDEYNSIMPGNPLTDDIEEQAAYFYDLGTFPTVFIRRLIDPHVFSGRPNAGHFAVADLLLTNSADLTVSANVDAMIETAGSMLLGSIGTGVSAEEVAALQPSLAPLLKIHGCWSKDRDTTLWTDHQLAHEPLKSRIPDAARWAQHRLMDRDIVVVGFFTDWDYLNTVLRDALHAVRPARVLVVDPSSPAELEAKAPELFAVGESATERFCHVQESGEVFLKALRVFFSQAFVREALHGGATPFEALKGAPPEAAWLEPTESDPKVLWRLRRDIEGCLPNRPATLKRPPAEPLMGLTILQLMAAGAAWEDSLLTLGGRRVRVLRASGQLLHDVQARYSRDGAPIVSPDAVIAVGADDLGLRGHLVRGASAASVARGSTPEWFDRARAEMEFGL
jgi:hypothetical protein